MIAVDPRLLEQFRHRLLAKRERYLRQVQTSGGYGLDQSLPESLQELSVYDNHPADVGSETFERGKDFALREGNILALGRIDEALEKIEEGTYGYCDLCGETIASERLDAVPESTLCRDCADAVRGQEDDFLRPLEETALDPPFGRTFTDGTGNVGYDGEDAWQEVAVYGTSETLQDVPEAESYDELYRDAGEPRGVVQEVENLSDRDTDFTEEDMPRPNRPAEGSGGKEDRRLKGRKVRPG